MKIRVTLFLVCFFLLAGVALVYAQSNPEPTEHLALTEDLVSKAGTKPIEITEAKYWSTPTSLNGFYCRVKNVSGREITALAVVWTTVSKGGTVTTRSHLIYKRLHPDIDPSGKPIAPGEQIEFSFPGTESFSGAASLKAVKVKADFVEFADGSIEGADTSIGYKELLFTRQGAELYRSWLVSVYEKNHQDIGAVAQKIADEKLPDFFELHNRHVKQGAAMYRARLKSALEKQGSDVLAKLFSREGSKI